MSENNQVITTAIKTIPVLEFPSYARKRTLENYCSVYCIIDIAKEKKLYPFLKYGDWEYYWFNDNWKTFEENQKMNEFSGPVPCLITLDPKKIAVRRFIEDRLGKELMIIMESSTSREDVIKHCYRLSQIGEDGSKSTFNFFSPKALYNRFINYSDEVKQFFFEYLDRIWFKNSDETILEFKKKQDKQRASKQPVFLKKKEKEKKVTVIGDWMSSLTDKKETQQDNNLSSGGFGVIGNSSSRSNGKLKNL